MSEQEQHPIRGVYESCIGVPDLFDAMKLWQQFGYRLVDHGSLTPSEAKAMYGVDSALESVQLRHKQCDHSFLRLMRWDSPVNFGVGISRNLRQDGARWGVILTQSIFNILNHAEDAAAQGDPWVATNPHWMQVYQMEKGKPFFNAPIGVREALALHPFYRLALFERYNYEKPTYGDIDETSFLKTSQFTHHGILVRSDDPSVLSFYDECLGLLKQKVHLAGGKPVCAPGNEAVYALEPGEEFFIHDFDDPRSSLEVAGHISGRLKIIRMYERSEMPSVYEQSRPGCLGMTLLTYQVRDLEEYRRKVTDGGATRVSNIADNEFGVPSFTFYAPDGNPYALIGDL